MVKSALRKAKNTKTNKKSISIYEISPGTTITLSLGFLGAVVVLHLFSKLV